MWMLCLYLRGLNLSNLPIAAELNLSANQAQEMTTPLRQDIADREEPIALDGEVECDEVYVVAGHKGNPEGVEKKGEKADADV